MLLTFLLLLPRCGRGRGRLCSSPSLFCSHAAGEEGGDCAPHLPPSAPTLRERKGGDCAAHLPPAAPTLRERKGEIVLLTFPLLLPRCGRGRGGMSRARVILRLSTIPRLRTRSPLSRSAGEGLGVRMAPHAMVVRARYVPNEKAGFLIRFYERSPRSNSIASRTISTVASSSIVLKSPKLSP